MRVPVINLPVVYHIGTLNPEHRGRQFKTSQEGAGLSVSLCPRGWERIARLGGNPWQELTRHDALFIDLHAIDNALLAQIQMWARDAGLLEPRIMWRAWNWDEEAERWGYQLFGEREAAVALFDGERDEDEDDDDLISRLDEELGFPSSATSAVEETAVWVLTDVGHERAAQFERDRDATDIAVMFWAEDVLRRQMPEVVGVWWPEVYEPEHLSAPRGAILPSCIGRFETKMVEPGAVDEDEDLLFDEPLTRLVSPAASLSAYRYITNCVDSTEELISSMIQSAAAEEMSFEAFIAALGNGCPLAGRSHLDAAFPSYGQAGFDISDDYHVRYHASAFDGMPCLYVVHSAVEYVFQRTGFADAPKVHAVEGNLDLAYDEDGLKLGR